MLTLFALPKPFKGHVGVIQRNAISQWVRLLPKPEIILLGKEEGTPEIAKEFALCHIPDVKCNEFGTPLLNDLFERAQIRASCNILCYVNADIMLLGDFMGAVRRVASWCDRFLMVGRRTNVELDEPSIYGSPDQEARILALVSRRGRLAAPNAIDYFVFPRGIFTNFPPFAIGRPWWDNWFLWKARASRVPLVDASAMILAVHQNHDYSHLPQGVADVMNCEEAKQNRQLAGSRFCTIEDATHKLTSNRTQYNFGHFLAPTKRVVIPWWEEFRYSLGPRRDRLARMLGRIAMISSR